MSNDDNPLIKALPPETDYLTYLTILEYNLTTKQLPVLHNVLQDVNLTSNIGWDLVHILLPLLPASEVCLQDVAHLGNPREVILKVTELLEAISQEEEDDDDQSQEDEFEEADGEDGEAENGPHEKEEKAVHNPEYSRLEEVQATSAGLDEVRSGPPSPATRFKVLLSMLSTLHPRINTKYPSRFLSTSLQAILPAYEKVVSDSTTTDAILSFVKSVSGSKRPALPPRRSSRSVPILEKLQSAPDPEASLESSGTQDLAVYVRLLQSFLTHVIEIYVDSMSSEYDECGFAWTSRLQEKSHPEKIVPGRKTFGSMFSEIETLRERDATIGRMIALARDLNINQRELHSVVTHPELEPSGQADELPSSASDISLSYVGSLYLLSAIQVSSILFNVPSSFHLSLYSPYFKILENFLGNLPHGHFAQNKGPLLDSALALGFLTFQNASWVADDEEADNSEAWILRLQQLSILIISIPSPTVRSHAQALTSAVIHSHPSKATIFQFLQSVLGNPGYELLKPSVVGWLKDEILAAARRPSSPKDLREKSMFADPMILSILSDDLFPRISTSSSSMPMPTTDAFYARIPFFLAVLNLFYLLCTSRLIYDCFYSHQGNNFLDIMDRITLKFVAPLREVTGNCIGEFSRAATPAGPEEGGGCSVEEMVELELLDDAISRAKEAFDAFKSRVTSKE